MLYREFEAALATVRDRTGFPKRGDPGPSTMFMTDMLNVSAGTHKVDGEQEFRPFYVAAKWLEQDLENQTLSEGGGAKFTGVAVPIRSLFDIQAALDKSLNVPPGFEIPDPNSNVPIKTKAELLAGYSAATAVFRSIQLRRAPS
jgi:hypothetical protein